MAIEDALAEYPGRGLVYTTDLTGTAWWIYFITGRSDASRARWVRFDPDGLVVAPIHASADPDSLRHYPCARRANDALVVGNGDHVDVLAGGLRAGVSLSEIVATIEPEPDPPIWTPRIALVIGEDARFVAVHRSGGEVVRRIEAVPHTPGSAAILTTYSGSATEPTGDAPYAECEESRSLQAMSDDLFYEHLDQRYRVLLVAGPVQRAAMSPSVESSFVLS